MHLDDGGDDVNDHVVSIRSDYMAPEPLGTEGGGARTPPPWEMAGCGGTQDVQGPYVVNGKESEYSETAME